MNHDRLSLLRWEQLDKKVDFLFIDAILNIRIKRVRLSSRDFDDMGRSLMRDVRDQ